MNTEPFLFSVVRRWMQRLQRLLGKGEIIGVKIGTWGQFRKADSSQKRKIK